MGLRITMECHSFNGYNGDILMMHTILLRGALPLALLTGLTGAAHAISLAPQYAGNYINGDGANSQWMQVSEGWRGALKGAEPTGTGIWGLADQAAVMNLNTDDPYVVKTLSRQVDQINFGDQEFNDTGKDKWGATPIAPIFSNAPGEYQENWASRFTGYLSITVPGDYNLGVLYDDGFHFTLMGASGQTVSLTKDGLNFPDRLGFAEDLQLSNGLYAFQLEAYERLEAGVVQLSWSTPTASAWAVIPKENLFTTPIPEPSMSLLMLAGLGVVGWRALKRS